MTKLTIRAQIVGIFTLLLLIVGATGWYIDSRLIAVERNMFDLATRAGTGVYQIGRIKEALAEDYLAFVTGGNASASDRSAVRKAIQAYEPTIATAEDREATQRLESAYADYEAAKTLLLAPQSGSSNAAIRNSVETKYRTALNAAGNVQTVKMEHAGQIATGIDEDLKALIKAMVATFVILTIVAVLAGFRLAHIVTVPLQRLTALMDAVRQGDFTRRMTIIRQDELGDLSEGFNRMADELMGLVGQVQRSGIRVSTSMTEIAATSKQQQATAAEVAATTTQIGATSREISATSKELVRTMNEVATVAEHAAGLASGGQAELAHMEDTMHQVMEAAGSINAKLSVLNERAGDINQMVTTITKVADQTNLLSLNAAIEAEKAGEYGRGFAVVSSEIRRLADQTAVATYDIEQMVKDIQSAVSASVMGMDKFSEEVRRGLRDVNEVSGKLATIITEVQTLVPRFESVSEGMQMQATGAEQISEALLQLTDATQQTVESLRQSSSAIDELSQVSGNLQGSIARFRLAAA